MLATTNHRIELSALIAIDAKNGLPLQRHIRLAPISKSLCDIQLSPAKLSRVQQITTRQEMKENRKVAEEGT
jgi:hypothetical protein